MSAKDTYTPPTLADYPQLTPEEIGRRFLKLVDSLKTFDDLTLEHIQEVMGLQMTPSPDPRRRFFNIYLPESGWYYGLYYKDDPRSDRRNLVYEFNNRPAGQEHNEHYADMAPVCGLDFHAYVAELEKMGFVEREDLAQYDSPMPPSIINAEGEVIGYEERRFFRLPGYTFTRDKVGVLIRERRQTYTSEEEQPRFCVEAISVGVRPE